jgi:hypothetical protein
MLAGRTSLLCAQIACLNRHVSPFVPSGAPSIYLFKHKRKSQPHTHTQKKGAGNNEPGRVIVIEGEKAQPFPLYR